MGDWGVGRGSAWGAIGAYRGAGVATSAIKKRLEDVEGFEYAGARVVATPLAWALGLVFGLVDSEKGGELAAAFTDHTLGLPVGAAKGAFAALNTYTKVMEDAFGNPEPGSFKQVLSFLAMVLSSPFAMVYYTLHGAYDGLEGGLSGAAKVIDKMNERAAANYVDPDSIKVPNTVGRPTPEAKNNNQAVASAPMNRPPSPTAEQWRAARTPADLERVAAEADAAHEAKLAGECPARRP